MYNPESDNIDSESSVSKTIEHNHVNIMTSHASKGLEYKHVIAVGFNIGNSISRDHEELTNLWYVTFTRAKESLHIFSVEAEKNQY
jgi:superfamily I DNA/RNA helicase